jgi:type II secretion system protein L
MSEILLLRLSADPNGCSWQRIDRLGNLLGPANMGSLDQAAESIAGSGRTIAVWCVVPQETVRAIEISVPVKDRRRARQAALYAIEDRVLGSLDETHVAQGEQERDGRWPQVAVSRRQMDAWISRLNDAGLVATRMICESDLLPREASLRLLWEPDRVLATSDDGRTVTCTPAQATKVVGRLCRDGTPIQIWSAQGHDPGPAAAELGAMGASVNTVELDRPVIAWYANQSRQRRDLVNLLQGRYRSAESAGRDLRTWGWAAAAVALVLTLQLITLALEIRELGQRQQVLMQDMASVWQEAMGSGARFDRFQARSRFEIALRGRGASGDAQQTDRFLAMVQILSTAGSGIGIAVDGLVLAADRLQVRIEAPDVSAVQELASLVTERTGAQVDIGEVDAAGTTVTAQININMAGSN